MWGLSPVGKILAKQPWIFGLQNKTTEPQKMVRDSSMKGNPLFFLSTHGFMIVYVFAVSVNGGRIICIEGV